MRYENNDGVCLLRVSFFRATTYTSAAPSTNLCVYSIRLGRNPDHCDKCNRPWWFFTDDSASLLNNNPAEHADLDNQLLEIEDELEYNDGTAAVETTAIWL